MIVALYRVPGAAALNRRYKDPFDQLWHRLGTTYGPALKRHPEARSHSASAGESDAAHPWRLRRDRV
jgi:hypothetical protein